MCLICSNYVKAGIVTPFEIRKYNGIHSQFDVDDSLQMIIKKISFKVQECNENPLIEHVTLLEEFGEGYIEYREPGADNILFLVDLKRQNNKTHIDIYSTWKTIKRSQQIVKILEYAIKGLGCPGKQEMDILK